MKTNAFVEPDDIRTLFSQALSSMYKTEVPQYGALLDLVADINAEVLHENKALAGRLREAGQLGRLDLERHGAIRLGTVDELSVATATHMVERTGEQGKKYKVDRSDPMNIRVKIKVKLNGVPDEVSKIKGLEDAIERSISMTTKGYHVDIVFVDSAGPDVFEFSVKFCEWPNSGNWASSPVTLSHEVHHALGLDDR